MFTNNRAHGVQISEGQSSLLSPAELPAPDHFIRMCPWNLESHDTTAQIDQINEEFPSYNQEVVFFKTTTADAQKTLNEIAASIKESAGEMKAQDNGGLLAMWVVGKDTVFGLFDNGANDIFQNIALDYAEDSNLSFVQCRHFTKDSTDPDFASFAEVFQSLEDAGQRPLSSFQPQLAIPNRVAKKAP